MIFIIYKFHKVPWAETSPAMSVFQERKRRDAEEAESRREPPVVGEISAMKKCNRWAIMKPGRRWQEQEAKWVGDLSFEQLRDIA